jgi:hypothetical protein
MKVPEWQADEWQSALWEKLARRRRNFWNLLWVGIVLWICIAGPLALIIMLAYGYLRNLLHWESTFFLFTDLGIFFVAHQLLLIVLFSYSVVSEYVYEERPDSEPTASFCDH